MRVAKTTDQDPDLSDQERARIRLHLEKVFESHAFARSQRSQCFLSYIVEETLAGRAAQIKEWNIGIDVFGRDENFDPQAESIVRVGAGEVRKRLAQAYQEGLEDGVRVELPVGSYRPQFKLEDIPHPDPKAAVAAIARSPRLPHILWMRGGRGVLYVCAFLFCAVAAALILPGFIRPRAPLDPLWNKFAGHKQPILIALPSPSVAEIFDSHPIDPDHSTGHGDVSGLKVLTGYYTGTGAGWAAARFAEQLALHHQQFILRFGKDVSYSDVEQYSTILLGGFTPLGMQMTSSLRYRLIPEIDKNEIVDSRGTGREWSIPSYQTPPESREGYTLISILHNPVSGYPLMIVAGLQPADTQAGAEFLTNNEYFRAFMQVAPKDWEEKNCQIVLHNHIYGNSPGKPIITAWYVW